MSTNNGVIRVGKKGLRKFAFGEEGTPGSEPFELDVVRTIQEWFNIYNEFREAGVENEEGVKTIPSAEIPKFHQAAVDFAEDCRAKEAKNQLAQRDYETSGYQVVTVAEALDFIARLRECYEELVGFFQPKSREEPASPATSAVELRFSEEGKTPK